MKVTRFTRRIRYEALEPRHMLAFVAGDFNLTGAVDQDDYSEWRGSYGQIGEPPADGNGDTVVNAADFVLWRNNLGATLADVPPDAPRGIEARAVGSTSIEVTWQAASNTTSYAVQRRQPDTETEFTTIAPSVAMTTYTDNTAIADTLYDYRVLAQNTNGSSPASQTAQATANQSNLTAYRPQGVQDFNNPTGTPIYNPFPKRPVSEQDEGSSTLGPGIRINADDDNQNAMPDRFEMGSAIPQENDLIEVKIDRLPGTGDLVLSAGFSLLLYYDHQKEMPLDSGEPIDFVNDTATIFVEWVDNHGTDTLTLIEQATQTPLDTIQFHSFRSMVVVFGGHGQNPMDTDGDGSIGDPINGGPNREGMFDVAQNLYVTGWDVYAYNEAVDPNVPYAEVTNAIDRRFVGNLVEDGGGVSIMGYSQGGGATHNLIERLWVEQDYITTFGVYLDAVEWNAFPFPHDLSFPETDWPEAVFYLLSIYQDHLLPNFRGGDIDDSEVFPGAQLEEHNVTTEAGWDDTLNHNRIDDDIQVQQTIRVRLQQVVPNR